MKNFNYDIKIKGEQENEKLHGKEFSSEH